MPFLNFKNFFFLAIISNPGTGTLRENMNLAWHRFTGSLSPVHPTGFPSVSSQTSLLFPSCEQLNTLPDFLLFLLRLPRHFHLADTKQ